MAQNARSTAARPIKLSSLVLAGGMNVGQGVASKDAEWFFCSRLQKASNCKQLMTKPTPNPSNFRLAMIYVKIPNSLGWDAGPNAKIGPIDIPANCTPCHAR